VGPDHAVVLASRKLPAALAIASSLVCSWTDFSGVDFLAIGKF